MTKKEFREKMFEVKKGIVRNNGFCCDWISNKFKYKDIKVRNEFSFIYKQNKHYSWWGESYFLSNQLMRIDALSLFEEYCITEGIYKGF